MIFRQKLKFADRLNITDRGYRIILKELLEKYIVCTHKLDTKGYECHYCCKLQPYRDWWCMICGAPTIMGEPDDSQEEDFDRYFETDEVCVLKYLGTTRFGNNLYMRI